MKKLIKKIFPNWTWDDTAKAGILKLEDGVPVEQVELEIPNAKTRKKIIADLDERGEVIGIEIIN